MNKGNIYNKNEQVLINGKNILNEEQNKTFDKLLDMVYPVGSIYMSVNSTDPSVLFGGTWAQIIGRFLWATVNNPMATGGSKTTNNTALTIDQIPSHNHTLSRPVWYNSEIGVNDYSIYGQTSTTTRTVANSTSISNTGGGQGHSHTYMPPYYEVYMWGRIA